MLMLGFKGSKQAPVIIMKIRYISRGSVLLLDFKLAPQENTTFYLYLRGNNKANRELFS